MKRTEHIVVRGTNWIGDCVMSIPALRELRRIFAGHRLTLLVRRWVTSVFEDQGLVDEIIVLTDSDNSWHRVLDSARRMRDSDRVVLFQNAFHAALCTFVARVPERIGYNTDARSLLLTRQATPRIQNLKRHQVFYYLDLLYQTGLSSHNYVNDPDFKPDIRLHPTREGLQQAQSLLDRTGLKPDDKLVLINPGAFYGPAKRWFLDRYSQLADRLIENEGVEVGIVGSSGEELIAQTIQSLMKHRPHIFTGQTDLSTLMGLLSVCTLFVTNDSGPMHLAAALNTPQIALFGSTDEIATGPFSNRARVIHKHVECSPCLLRECPIDLRCFSQITVSDVYELARGILRG